MPTRLALLSGAQALPQFAQPDFLASVETDSGGVDGHLSFVDSLLSSTAAPMAVEDSLLGGFLSDLGTDTPAESDFNAVDASPLLSDHAEFVGTGDALHTTVSGQLAIPAPPALDFLPKGEVGKALALLQAELNAKYGTK